MRLRLLSSAALTSVITCLSFSTVLAATCTEAPDCLSLGYTLTASDCPKGYVKCPWNTGLVYCKCGEYYQYDCTGSNETAGSSQCGNKYKDCGCASGYTWNNGSCAQRPCEIGDIFYTDNTCVTAANHDSSKTVLGIVVHITDSGKHGQIMAPWPIDTNGNKTSSNTTTSTLTWGVYGTDISGLTNYSSAEAAAKDYNSCGNTDKIVAKGAASKYPAAWATRKYAPTTETSGKWCLPAAGIMTNIYNNKSAIDTAISKVSGVAYPQYHTWSSSESDGYNAWGLNFKNSYGLNAAAKNIYGTVYFRPVLEF